jgi:hypothetical protein
MQHFFFRKTPSPAPTFSSDSAVFQQKPGMQLFFFRKTHHRPGVSEPARLCLIDTACSGLLADMLDNLGSDRWSEPAHIGSTTILQ